MKRAGTIALCLAGGWLGFNGLPVQAAEEAVLPGNPYAVVVARNIFGLNPPAPVDPNASKAVEPPVKIIPNGIMTILGQLQVLFKVAAKPPGKEESYIFTEGQSQDDIEVVKINEKAGIITFNNHGVMQELPLAEGKASGGAAPAAAGGKPGGPGIVSSPAAAGGNPFIHRFGSRSSPGASGGANPNEASGLHNVPTRSPIASQIPEGMTPEGQIIGIEANRMILQQQGDPTAGLLPPTELTPDDATGPSGGPLVTPSPEVPPHNN